jgi:hypothetical protein
MASEGNVDWRSIVKKSSRLEKKRRQRAEAREEEGTGREEDEEEEASPEDPLTLAVEETLRIHAEVSSLSTILLLGYQLNTSWPFSCRCRKKTIINKYWKALSHRSRSYQRTRPTLTAFPYSTSTVPPLL